MPKQNNGLPYELLALLRSPLTNRLVSTKALQILYIRSAKLISKRSRRFLITAIPAVRQQLRWAVLFAIIRAYVAFMRRIIMDPRSGLERTVNKSGAWLLLVALRERIRMRLRKRAEGTAGAGQQFSTPPTSPAASASSLNSYMSAPQQIPDYFLRSTDADPVLHAVRQIIPDATGYRVILPAPVTPSDATPGQGHTRASNDLARQLSNTNSEMAALFQDGTIRKAEGARERKEKVVALVIMEDGEEDGRRVKAAVTVDAPGSVGHRMERVTSRDVEELGVSFAEALDV